NWTNQIGHVGMLDMMLRMRRLGWWDGVALVLAVEGAVANETFLSAVTAQPGVIVVRERFDSSLMQDLLSLLRSHGLPYHVMQPPGMPFMRWHEAAALALHVNPQMETWSLAPAVDQMIASSGSLEDRFDQAMREWGIGDGGWYVCLHIRESGYHDA